MNNNSEEIFIGDYNYDLPEDKIAKFPLKMRDGSKLLYYRQGKIESRIFKNLSLILSKQHHLIFNDTRVIHARLLFSKATGAAIEIFLLEPFLPEEYILSFNSNRSCVWKCLAGNAKKWKNEILRKELIIGDSKVILEAEKTSRESNYFLIRFSWDDDTKTFSSIIDQAGRTPIPPYLNREDNAEDSSHYQTVYSNNEGSVAAPTAGLHFTEMLLKDLRNAGISQTRLTLHVGAGTFLPVKNKNARDHEMHTEHVYITKESIQEIALSDKQIIAVGTTSVRMLESLYHLACKINSVPGNDKGLFIDQWEPYSNEAVITRKESMNLILGYMDTCKINSLKFSTRIMITPGYQFRMIDGMITNFHQPASTLLLLVSAFIGEDWKKVYDYALENDFRFLSYGDSSLLIR